MIMVPDRYGRTDRQTDRQFTVTSPRSALASRGKNACWKLEKLKTRWVSIRDQFVTQKLLGMKHERQDVKWPTLNCVPNQNWTTWSLLNWHQMYRTLRIMGFISNYNKKHISVTSAITITTTTTTVNVPKCDATRATVASFVKFGTKQFDKILLISTNATVWTKGVRYLCTITTNNYRILPIHLSPLNGISSLCNTLSQQG